MNTIAGARMSGCGGSVIMFVHGVGSTAAVWDPQLRAFSDRYRCFAVELRGNGASKPEPDPETIDRSGFVQDVLAVADAARAPRFHFVGCSLGGVVAFELLKHVPERFLSVTLVGSFAAYGGAQTYAQSVAQAARACGSMERFAGERAAKLGLRPGARTEETIAQMACKSLDSYIASTFATWTGDYRALLPFIGVPCLVICGERDAVAPRRYSEEIARAVPGARLEILSGAGHVANADEPERFNRVLRHFLEANGEAEHALT
ncbi:MAG: alpha/beta fold hydrolase [Candidatus Baltobacteraceae bacterium]